VRVQTLESAGNNPALLLFCDNKRSERLREDLAKKNAEKAGVDYLSLKQKLYQDSKKRTAIKFGSNEETQSWLDQQCSKFDYASLGRQQVQKEHKNLTRVSDSVTVASPLRSNIIRKLPGDMRSTRNNFRSVTLPDIGVNQNSHVQAFEKELPSEILVHGMS
jgi:hypothetical protein